MVKEQEITGQQADGEKRDLMCAGLSLSGVHVPPPSLGLGNYSQSSL